VILELRRCRKKKRRDLQRKWQTACLPPVPTQLWAQNRHVPFTAALTGQPTITEAVALGYIRTLRNSSALYTTSVTPRITFPADALAATLHNLPEDTFPNGSSE